MITLNTRQENKNAQAFAPLIVRVHYDYLSRVTSFSLTWLSFYRTIKPEDPLTYLYPVYRQRIGPGSWVNRLPKHAVVNVGVFYPRTDLVSQASPSLAM